MFDTRGMNPAGTTFLAPVDLLAPASPTAPPSVNGYRLNGIPLLNPVARYAVGTPYILTQVSSPVVLGGGAYFAETQIEAAGSYAIFAKAKVSLNNATFQAPATLTLKIRRVNNTPADLTYSFVQWVVPAWVGATQTLALVALTDHIYVTDRINDNLQMFADISALPTVGTISIDATSILYVRVG